MPLLSTLSKIPMNRSVLWAVYGSRKQTFIIEWNPVKLCSLRLRVSAWSSPLWESSAPPSARTPATINYRRSRSTSTWNPRQGAGRGRSWQSYAPKWAIQHHGRHMGSPTLQPEQDQKSLAKLRSTSSLGPRRAESRQPPSSKKPRSSNTHYTIKKLPLGKANNFQATTYKLLDAVGHGIPVLEVDWMIGHDKYVPSATRRVPWTWLGFEPSSQVSSLSHHLSSNSNALRLFPYRDKTNPKNFKQYPHKFIVGVYRAKKPSGNDCKICSGAR